MGNSTGLTGIILAGGEGRRMGGQDKGWVDLCGRPLIQHVLERVAPQVDQCIISANRNLSHYQALGVSVVHDDTAYLGPLAGIAAALALVATDYALVVPTDAPLIPHDLAERLLPHSPARLVICHDGERLQPLFGLYHRSLLASIQAFLDSGQRQLTRWCMEQSPAVVTISDIRPFANLNTGADLARIQAELQTTIPGQ